ncbi:hypothetical protein [Vulgatibacter sp.]|uniref:hypothetical protein n=1 Tax=Vulgatibacter sp. TaxID=1971226 RepID=UPI0035684B9E
MAELSRKKIIREGIVAGIIGGAAFAAGQTLAAAIMGLPPGAPWQFFASVAGGAGQMEGRLDIGTFVLGAFVHFGLSAAFGALFGLIVAAIKRPVRNNLTLELAGGAAYGLVLWAINMELIGRWLYPWYVSELNAVTQALIHAVFFGVPMATWLALRIRDVETPGVHAARHRYQTSSGDEELLRLHQWEAHNEAEHKVLSGTRLPGERPTEPRGEEGRQPPGSSLH